MDSGDCACCGGRCARLRTVAAAAAAAARAGRPRLLALEAIVFEREDGGVTAGTDPDLLIHCRIHRHHTRRRRNRRGRRLPRSSHTVRHTVPCCCLLLQDLSTHGSSGASPAVPRAEVPASGWQWPNRVCIASASCASAQMGARTRDADGRDGHLRARHTRGHYRRAGAPVRTRRTSPLATARSPPLLSPPACRRAGALRGAVTRPGRGRRGEAMRRGARL